MSLKIKYSHLHEKIGHEEIGSKNLRTMSIVICAVRIHQLLLQLKFPINCQVFVIQALRRNKRIEARETMSPAQRHFKSCNLISWLSSLPPGTRLTGFSLWFVPEQN